jgi:hypothetical protein
MVVVGKAIFHWVLGKARAGQLLGDEHFTVDGILLVARASHKHSAGRWVRKNEKDRNQSRRRYAGRRTIRQSTWGSYGSNWGVESTPKKKAPAVNRA